MLSAKDKILLFPYWLTLKVRHFLFDKKIKKSVSYSVGVICIGNITVGGTGKTPTTELLLRALSSESFVKKHGKIDLSVLSRGYKRKSKGFKLLNVGDDYKLVGDEPLQIKNKFPNVEVAVCENRRYGIEMLQKGIKEGEQQMPNSTRKMIILDDAFQHRQVLASCSIVLMNYNRPIFNDHLLPLGRLRDLPEQIKRANVVIVTNSPIYYGADEYVNSITEKEFLDKNQNDWRKNLGLSDSQKLYFAATSYCNTKPVFSSLADPRYVYAKSAAYFSGIANDRNFRDHITDIYKLKDSISFTDHCNFSKGDIDKISKMAKKYPLSILLTTEKDSVRLSNNKFLSNEIKKRLFYVPIELRIVGEDKLDDLCQDLLKSYNK